MKNILWVRQRAVKRNMTGYKSGDLERMKKETDTQEFAACLFAILFPFIA